MIGLASDPQVEALKIRVVMEDLLSAIRGTLVDLDKEVAELRAASRDRRRDERRDGR